jgi:hypothetical protein
MMSEYSEIRDQLFKAEFGEEPTDDDLKLFKWNTARLAWLLAWKARGLVTNPYKETIVKGDLGAWLRHRATTNEMVHVPAKMAEAIAAELDRLKETQK